MWYPGMNPGNRKRTCVENPVKAKIKSIVEFDKGTMVV